MDITPRMPRLKFMTTATTEEIGHVGCKIVDAIGYERADIALSAIWDVFVYVLEQLPAEDRARLMAHTEAMVHELAAAVTGPAARCNNE